MSYVLRKCNHCEEDYQAEQRYLNRGQGLFCSRQCSSAHNSAKRKVDPIPNAVCATCKKDIYKKPSNLKKSKSGLFFCSTACQNVGYAIHIVKPGPKVRNGGQSKLQCQFCPSKTTHEDLICSACKIQIDVDKWKAGDVSVTWLPSTKEPRSFVKRELKLMRGDACELCGFDKKCPDGSSIIQMDHIDGNYMNNHLDNLRLLCPNCHAMTDTYGSKNKGQGRPSRRKV